MRKRLHIFGRAHRMMHHRPFARLKFKRQPHRLERQQQIGKDDGRVNAQLFGRGDGHFGGQFRLLADFHQRVVLANVAVFLHIAPGLAQKPDRRAIDRLAQAGPHKSGAFENRLLAGGSVFNNIHVHRF